MTGDDAWDRFTRFFAPALFFYTMISVLMIHLTYVNAVVLGATELQQKNPLYYVLSSFGYPFAFYFIFLSYIECKDLLKSLRVVHKPLVISAFLVMITFLLWLYEQWCIFLFGGTLLYRDVVQLSYPIWFFTEWWTIELLPGFIGSVIAMVNMVFLYKQLKKPLPIMSEEEAGRYVIGVFKFLTGISEVIGGTSLTIFRSTVEGYNERFCRNIKINDTIQLSGLNREEWPAFIRFMLDVYYKCIGPITWDIARDVEELKGFVESGSVSLGA